MVYLILNLWSLKMYTATVWGGGGRAGQPIPDKYFKEKYTSGKKCEPVNEKLVTVYLKVQIKLIERLQTKWFDAQIQ
jgi:hypothetical protein